jgi:hypothetical protein
MKVVGMELEIAAKNKTGCALWAEAGGIKKDL